jgi:putative ABC transport system permease protein
LRFLRTLVLSLQLLAAHKLRTLLSLSGIVVGVGAVVLMVSAGRGAEKELLDRIRAMGRNLLVVNAAPARIVAGRQRQAETTTALFPADAEALVASCPAVVRASPAVSRPAVAARESRAWKTTVVGMTEDGIRIRNIPLRWGRFFDGEDDRVKRRVAVLGPTVVDNLFAGEDPVGLPLLLGRVPFEVVGVAVRRGTDPNGTDQDDVVFVPLETAMRRLMNVNYVQTILVEARSEEALVPAEAEVRETLRGRRRTSGGPDPFSIQNQAALLAAQRETARSMTLLTGTVAAISLAVGGVGILAVMLISVRERTREIGLRRALGARRRDIVLQFVAEAAILGGAGGAIGVLAGAGGSAALPALGLGGTLLSWPAAGTGFVFALSVGLVFGIYPALRAARLEPIRALRSE